MSFRVVAAVLLAIAAFGAAQAVTGHRSAASPTARATSFASPADIPDDVRARGLRFAAGVVPADRARIEAAIRAARPAAQALVADVDGLVTVRVGDAGASAVGLTASTATGYDVTIDLRRAYLLRGDRGVARVVLHELGHVVDFALLHGATRARLAAGIPRGWGCDGGVSGACAQVEERLAETFAKWAADDIGVGVGGGYRVPPPPSLEAWGAPLDALARR